MAARLLASKILNETEAQILCNEFNSPRLDWLNPDQFHNKLIDLVSEIKLITGALIYPDGSAEQNLQLEVIKRFLATKRFRMLHAKEITQAFYMNAAGMYPEVYRHYNREINAEFLGDVLNAYLRYKDRFVAEKIGAINALVSPQAKPGRADIDWKALINQDLVHAAAGDLHMIVNCAPKYNAMRRLQYIKINSKKHWWRWYFYAIEQKEKAQIRKPASTSGERIAKKNALIMYDAIKMSGEIPTGEHINFVHFMRRVIYLEYLKALASCGISDIFTQVSP